MPIFSSHKSIPSASWLAVSCLVLLFSPVAQGQSQQSGALRSVAAIIAETEPVNDAVLADAPSQLHLVFPARVRLVKLVLYGANHEWVDIGFRYNPGPQNKFSWPVPELPKAAYYSAFWAILGSGDELIRGSFSFAFGVDAEVPSVVMAREEIRMEFPEFELRELERLGIDPANIIINNQPSRAFEPPFAPILN